MSLRILTACAFGLLSSGCIPVTQPVGDIDKAEPNMDLIGSWLDEESPPQLWVVDRPEVKGNPKGLMRVRIVAKGKKIEDARPNDTMWFFTSTVGKHIYANLLVPPDKPEASIDFGKEDGYTAWMKSKNPGFFIAQLTLKGPVLTIDPGNQTAFEELMKDEKIDKNGEFYRTKSGWLAGYLEKTGPAKIFTNGKGKNTLRRLKEKE
jgi:hypothetical protein